MKFICIFLKCTYQRISISDGKWSKPSPFANKPTGMSSCIHFTSYIFPYDELGFITYLVQLNWDDSNMENCHYGWDITLQMANSNK